MAGKYAGYTSETMDACRAFIYSLFPELAPDRTLIVEVLRWADDGGCNHD